MSTSRTSIFLLAVAVQVSILIAVPAQKYAAYLFGAEIELRVLPRDPDSFLSGRFAALRFEIDTPMKDTPAAALPDGATVYCLIQRESNGIWNAKQFSPTPPLRAPGDVAIKGTMKSGRIEYGIEAFFLPEEAAMGIDEKLRNRSNDCRARARVDSHGNAVLTGLVINGDYYGAEW